MVSTWIDEYSIYNLSVIWLENTKYVVAYLKYL